MITRLSGPLRGAAVVVVCGGILFAAGGASRLAGQEGAGASPALPGAASAERLAAIEEQIVQLITATDELIAGLRQDLRRTPSSAPLQRMLSQAEEDKRKLARRLEDVRRLRAEPSQ